MAFLMDFLHSSFTDAAPKSEQWLDLSHEKDLCQKSPETSKENFQLSYLNSQIGYIFCDPPNHVADKNPTELNTSMTKPCNNNVSEDTGFWADDNSNDLIDVEDLAVSYFSEMLYYHGHCQVLSIQDLFKFKLNGSPTIQKISGSDVHQLTNFLMLYPDHFLVTNNYVIGKNKLTKLSNSDIKKFTDPLFISIFYFFKNYTKNASLFDTGKLYKDIGRYFLYSDRTPIFNSKDVLISFLSEYPNVFYADSHRVINLISSCKKAKLHRRSSYNNSAAFKFKKYMKHRKYLFKNCSEYRAFNIKQQPQASTNVMSSDSLEDNSPIKEIYEKDEYLINIARPIQQIKIDYLQTVKMPNITECIAYGTEKLPQIDTHVLCLDELEIASFTNERNYKGVNTMNLHEPTLETKIKYWSTLELQYSSECLAVETVEPQAVTLKHTSLTKENNIKGEDTGNTKKPTQQIEIDYLETVKMPNITECIAYGTEKLPQIDTHVLCLDELEIASFTNERNYKGVNTMNLHEPTLETKIKYWSTLELQCSSECLAVETVEPQAVTLKHTSLTKENNIKGEDTGNTKKPTQQIEIDYLETVKMPNITECIAYGTEELPQIDTHVLCLDELEIASFTNERNYKGVNTMNLHEPTLETKIKYWSTLESQYSSECLAVETVEPQAVTLKHTSLTKENNIKGEDTGNTKKPTQQTEIDHLEPVITPTISECIAYGTVQLQADQNVLSGHSFEDTSPTNENNNVYGPTQETRLVQTIEKGTECFAVDTDALCGVPLEYTSLTHESNKNNVDINIHELSLQMKVNYSQSIDSPKYAQQQSRTDYNILCTDTFQQTMEPSKRTDCVAANIEQHLPPDSDVLCCDTLKDTSTIYDTQSIIKPETIWPHIRDINKIDICKPSIDGKINDLLTITDHLQINGKSQKIKTIPFDMQKQLQVSFNDSCSDTLNETLCINKNMLVRKPVTSKSYYIHKHISETEIIHLGETVKDSHTIELPNCDSFPFHKEQQHSIIFLFGSTLDNSSSIKKNESIIKPRLLLSDIWNTINLCEPTIDSKINHLLIITDHLQTKFHTIESPESFYFGADQHLSAGLNLLSGETFENSVSVKKNMPIINPVTSNFNFLNMNIINVHEPTIDNEINHFPATNNYLQSYKSLEFIECLPLNTKWQQADLMFSFHITLNNTPSIEKNLAVIAPSSLIPIMCDKINICEPTGTKINHLLTITDHLQTKLPTIEPTKRVDCIAFNTDDHLTTDFITLSIEKNMSIIKRITSNFNIGNFNAVNICEPTLETKINLVPTTSNRNQLEINETLESIECLAIDKEPQQAHSKVSFGQTLEDPKAIKNNKSTINPETPNCDFWDKCEPTLDTEINYLSAVELTKSNEYFASDAEQHLHADPNILYNDISENNKWHGQFLDVDCRKFDRTSMGGIENSVVEESDFKLDDGLDNKKITAQCTGNFISQFKGLKKNDFERLTEKALIFLNSKLWEGDEMQILKIDKLFMLFLSEFSDLTKYCKHEEEFRDFISMFHDDFIVSNDNVMARKNKIHRSCNIAEECIPTMLSNFFDMYTQNNDSITVKQLYRRVGKHFYNNNQSQIFKFSEQLMLFLKMFPDLFYIDNNLKVINLTCSRKNVNASLEVSKCDEYVDSSVDKRQINTFVDTKPSLQWKDLVLKRTQIVEDKNDCRRITEAILKSENIIAVDCEGVNLGASGTLSLVQVGLESGYVYIFDIVKDNTMVIDGGLKKLFESESIVKVIHDSNNDTANLYNEYGVEIKKIFDTRVAHHLIANSNITNYKQLNNCKAIGLNELCVFYGAPTNTEKDRMKGVYKRNRKFWNERPLTNVMIAYATLDVACLVPQLYDTMRLMILLNGISEGLIRELSFKHSRSSL